MLFPIDKELKIFLSSTYFNLKDIRGTIKYSLEKYYNFKVFASEFPDFSIGAAKHSFEECLDIVRSCNFLILIIDERFGNTYQVEDGKKISITEAEFRAARENKIPILTFVRKRVWIKEMTSKFLLKEVAWEKKSIL